MTMGREKGGIKEGIVGARMGMEIIDKYGVDGPRYCSISREFRTTVLTRDR